MKRRLETKKVGDAIHPPPKGMGLLALIIKSSLRKTATWDSTTKEITIPV